VAGLVGAGGPLIDPPSLKRGCRGVRVRRYLRSAGMWHGTTAGGPPGQETFRNNPCWAIVSTGRGRGGGDSDGDDDEETSGASVSNGPKVVESNGEIPLVISLQTLPHSEAFFNDSGMMDPDAAGIPRNGDPDYTRHIAPRAFAVAVTKVRAVARAFSQPALGCARST